ncbi:methyltransferase domain-containing protein [Streptomyces sp. S3(2020)]|uniref:methyltransferase domain-containing protein n=1 Tax=Streptomyces sp. S3(2020) TaxID=2732044 RepID=UPI001487B031|nr:methyltransferase domain-containing protein [Streptomyces sp. S3(2020)]NNN38063.1 methyltransferase domain-containing protein [Streptomyces sp. S3(2020)]
MKRLRTRVSDLDQRRRYRSSARAMLTLDPEPESWLDVGTGDARFPAVAKALFPYTSFDGLDITTAVLGAREAERVEEAYIGSPADPHLTKALAGRYDVVSVLNPVEDLAAALAFLRPGGHVLMETAGAADDLRTELEAHDCTVLPTNRHPVLDRLSRTTRVIARREPSPS